MLLSAVLDPVERYSFGWTQSTDPFKSRDLINSGIEMRKETPRKSVFGGEGFLYKDWVELHELMMGKDTNITLDERKEISSLLSSMCEEILK